MEDSVFCKSFISKLEKYLGMCMILIILDDQLLVTGLREIFNNIDLYKKSNAF